MYLAELCDVVAIALAELSVLLQSTEVCEALLKLTLSKFGCLDKKNCTTLTRTG